MTNETFKDIEKLESDLWEAADNLRANSKLTSSDYYPCREIRIHLKPSKACLHRST